MEKKLLVTIDVQASWLQGRKEIFCPDSQRGEKVAFFMTLAATLLWTNWDANLVCFAKCILIGSNYVFGNFCVHL